MFKPLPRGWDWLPPPGGRMTRSRWFQPPVNRPPPPLRTELRGLTPEPCGLRTKPFGTTSERLCTRSEAPRRRRPAGRRTRTICSGPSRTGRSERIAYPSPPALGGRGRWDGWRSVADSRRLAYQLVLHRPPPLVTFPIVARMADNDGVSFNLNVGVDACKRQHLDQPKHEQRRPVG